MKVIAMADKSAGNESVGDMWTETAEFDESAPISSILEWAGMVRVGFTGAVAIDLRQNVRLSILQSPGKRSDQ